MAIPHWDAEIYDKNGMYYTIVVTSCFHLLGTRNPLKNLDVSWTSDEVEIESDSRRPATSHHVLSSQFPLKQETSELWLLGVKWRDFGRVSSFLFQLHYSYRYHPVFTVYAMSYLYFLNEKQLRACSMILSIQSHFQLSRIVFFKFLSKKSKLACFALLKLR